jgi:hypothetical protein
MQNGILAFSPWSQKLQKLIAFDYKKKLIKMPVLKYSERLIKILVFLVKFGR